MPVIKMCPVCLTPFRRKYGDDGVTCSRVCANIWGSRTKQQRDVMKKRAESLKREPEVHCNCYDPKIKSCMALTGLWCEWEDCSFHKEG